MKKYLFVQAPLFKMNGFLLFEALIYIIIGSIFSLILFQFCIESYNNYSKIRKFNSQISSINTAFDLIIKDLQSSEVNDQGILNKGESQYLWTIKNDKLIKVETIAYNKTEIIVALNIKKLDFIVKNKIVTISLESILNNKPYKLCRTVRINIGEINE